MWNVKLVYRFFVYEYECEVYVVIEFKFLNWLNFYINLFLVFRGISICVRVEGEVLVM